MRMKIVADLSQVLGSSCMKQIRTSDGTLVLGSYRWVEHNAEASDRIASDRIVGERSLIQD